MHMFTFYQVLDLLKVDPKLKTPLIEEVQEMSRGNGIELTDSFIMVEKSPFIFSELKLNNRDDLLLEYVVSYTSPNGNNFEFGVEVINDRGDGYYHFYTDCLEVLENI